MVLYMMVVIYWLDDGWLYNNSLQMVVVIFKLQFYFVDNLQSLV